MNQLQLNEVVSRSDQTPIEVILQVDENGMTTARKLYAFLELATNHYAGWCKRNILDDKNAFDGTDYVRLPFEGETPTGGKIERIDYKLTASFAKKLAMQTKNARGEQARDYFIKVEEKLRQTAIAMRDNKNIALMETMLAEIKTQQSSIANMDERFTSSINIINERLAIMDSRPRERYADQEPQSRFVRNNVYSSTAIAVAFGMGSHSLNKILATEGVLTRVSAYFAETDRYEGFWLITDEYRPMKYTVQKYVGLKNPGIVKPIEVTYAWTPRGVGYIVDLLKRKGFTQREDISNRTKSRTWTKGGAVQ